MIPHFRPELIFRRVLLNIETRLVSFVISFRLSVCLSASMSNRGIQWTDFHEILYWEFLISNFRRVVNVVCFLLGNSPASEFYMPTFRNTLFRLHRQVGMKNNN
jgi:hypothetical protein